MVLDGSVLENVFPEKFYIRQNEDTLHFGMLPMYMLKKKTKFSLLSNLDIWSSHSGMQNGKKPSGRNINFYKQSTGNKGRLREVREE